MSTCLIGQLETPKSDGEREVCSGGPGWPVVIPLRGPEEEVTHRRHPDRGFSAPIFGRWARAALSLSRLVNVIRHRLSGFRSVSARNSNTSLEGNRFPPAPSVRAEPVAAYLLNAVPRISLLRGPVVALLPPGKNSQTPRDVFIGTPGTFRWSSPGSGRRGGMRRRWGGRPPDVAS